LQFYRILSEPSLLRLPDPRAEDVVRLVAVEVL
jgi:hypothetical protein